MKTLEEVKAEIAKLKELEPKVRPTTFFGDDNKAAIAAQIRVLEESMDEDTIYDEWPEEDESHTRDAALDACMWRMGEVEEDGTPSVQWEPLCK